MNDPHRIGCGTFGLLCVGIVLACYTGVGLVYLAFGLL